MFRTWKGRVVRILRRVGVSHSWIYVVCPYGEIGFLSRLRRMYFFMVQSVAIRCELVVTAEYFGKVVVVYKADCFCN